MRAIGIVDGAEKQLDFIVVRADRPYGLLGRNFIDSGKSAIATFTVEESELPTIKGYKASISLINENEGLRFCKARPVAMHLRQTLDAELERLENWGIISPVDHTNHAILVVWVKKSNGQYKMCVDFKATLNSNIQLNLYPMPTSVVSGIYAQVR